MSIFDITQTPWTELVKLETFLGLEPQLGRDNFYFNTSKVTQHYSALLSIGLPRKCDPTLLIAQGFYCGRQEVPRPGSEWSCVRTKCLSASKASVTLSISTYLYIYLHITYIYL